MRQYYIELKQTVLQRGYITVEELGALQEESYLPKGTIVRDILERGYAKMDESKALRSDYCAPNETVVTYSTVVRIKSPAWDLTNTVIEKDLLPFKAMFYLALEKEDYDEAEIVKLIWLDWLKEHQQYIGISQISKLKVNQQITKLTSVVGLTDPMAISLRKELMTTLKAKRWDEAQKIQSILTARVNELSPPPQVVQTPGGQTTIIVPQEPSTKHVTVEQIPRYGATDVGRAVSLITRGSSALTPKEAGTLGLFDILMKR
jgi:hypothetical protein